MKPLLPDIVISIGQTNVKIAVFSGAKGNRKLSFNMSMPLGNRLFVNPLVQNEKPGNLKTLVSVLKKMRKKGKIKKFRDTHLIFSDSFCIQRTILAGLSSTTSEMQETVYSQLSSILPTALDSWYIGYKLMGLYAKRNIIYSCAAIKNNIDHLIDSCTKAGFNIISMTNRSSDTFNLFHEFMEDPSRQGLNMGVLNMCTVNSTLAVFKHGMLRHVQAIALGGENFTKCLASGLNISSSSAEELKKESTIFLPEETPEQESVQSYSALVPLLQKLSKSIFSVMENYFQIFDENKLDEIIILGRSADMSNFSTGLKSLLNTKCMSGYKVLGTIPEFNPKGINSSIINEYSSLLGSQKRI
jgi:Tfp pilus assembly PilM family ATPase